METTTQITTGTQAIDCGWRRAGADEYERLLRWVDDDLADIHDPEATSVKQAFLAAYFPRDRVDAALAEMEADPSAALRRRLLHREPLPALDALLVSAPDPRSRGQLERAAALAWAAMDLYRSGEEAGSAVLGSTQVPGLDADHIVKARAPASVAVLVDGRPYLLSGASCLSLDDLMDALAWLLADAPGRAPSTPLGVLTSATRPTCHALRARLLDDPESAEAIAAIEGAVFVLCLDGGSASPAASLKTASRALFSRRENRWYGAPQIIVDAAGHAGVIEGYSRGLNAAEVIAFAEGLSRRSRDAVRSRPGLGRAGLPGQVTPLSLRCRDDDPVFLAAEKEATTAFHAEDPFFSLGMDRAWFQSRGLSPNAAIQYLLILAAHDVWGGETPPTLTLAVRRGSALDWILAPTHGLRRSSDEEVFARLRTFAARLAARVEACKQAPSPSLLFSTPPGGLDERLLRVFRRVAEHHDSAYRGYLFRATRAPGTIDLLTSTLALPDSVAYLGRPGATSPVVSRFGVHILPREGSMDLIYIPNPRHSGDLPRFHARLEHLAGRLSRAL